jgi:hypothetical protein
VKLNVAHDSGMPPASFGSARYELDGPAGLHGRNAALEATSAHSADWPDGSRHLAKVRVAGSNPVVRSNRALREQGFRPPWRSSARWLAHGLPMAVVASIHERITS